MHLLSSLLKRFVQQGTLRVIDADGKIHEFTGTPEPLVSIRFHDPSLPRKLFFNPELHAGESYMDGRLTLVDCSTLEDFAIEDRPKSAQAGREIAKFIFLKAVHQVEDMCNPAVNISHFLCVTVHSHLKRVFLLCRQRSRKPTHRGEQR